MMGIGSHDVSQPQRATGDNGQPRSNVANGVAAWTKAFSVVEIMADIEITERSMDQ